MQFFQYFGHFQASYLNELLPEIWSDLLQDFFCSNLDTWLMKVCKAYNFLPDCSDAAKFDVILKTPLPAWTALFWMSPCSLSALFPVSPAIEQRPLVPQKIKKKKKKKREYTHKCPHAPQKVLFGHPMVPALFAMKQEVHDFFSEFFS